MPSLELVLVRHGQSEGNVAAEAAIAADRARIDVPARDPDVELSALGRRQAGSVGAWWAALPDDERPTALWVSPYRRARQTAEIAAEKAGVDLVPHVDERLRDRDMGITDMLTARGIQEKYPEETERRAWIGRFYYRPPGGESWADVAGRVRGVLTDVRALVGEGTVLIVAHDVVNLMFCAVAEGWSEEEMVTRSRTDGLRNAALCRLSADEGSPTGWKLTAYNVDEHLRARGVDVTEQPGASDDFGREGNDDE